MSRLRLRLKGYLIVLGLYMLFQICRISGMDLENDF